MSDSDSDAGEPRPAFPLPPPCSPPPGPPQTAEQYLQLVRQEAAALPDVFVAPRLTPALPAASALRKRLRLPHTPEQLLPDERWQGETLADFVRVQKAFAASPQRAAEVPRKGEWKRWKELVFGEEGPSDSVVRASGFLRIVEALEVVDAELDGGWAEEGEEKVAEEVAGKLLGGKAAEWVYALLVAVEMPISGDTASIVRSLLRKMTIARLALSSTDDSKLARVNVLITILDKHFGQGDAPTSPPP